MKTSAFACEPLFAEPPDFQKFIATTGQNIGIKELGTQNPSQFAAVIPHIRNFPQLLFCIFDDSSRAFRHKVAAKRLGECFAKFEEKNRRHFLNCLLNAVPAN